MRRKVEILHHNDIRTSALLFLLLGPVISALSPLPLSTHTCFDRHTKSCSGRPVIFQGIPNHKSLGLQTDGYSKSTTVAMSSPSSFSKDLTRSLDLIPLLEEVARYTTTQRGYRAFLSLVNNGASEKKTSKPGLMSFGISQRIERLKMSDNNLIPNRSNEQPLLEIASSIEQVNYAYQLVEEASILLHESNQSDTEDSTLSSLYYPPIYGADSHPWDVDSHPLSDDDEWLFLPPHEFEALHILQAEQVINMLLQVHHWSQMNEIRCIAPILTELACQVKIENLKEVLIEIEGKVEIVRVRSVTDIKRKGDYFVRIKDDQFPVLSLLREKEMKLLQRGGKEYDQDMVSVRDEIESTTKQVSSWLAQCILGSSTYIDHGLHVIAKLDTIFARAAFGSVLNGSIPIVKNNGEISVDKFVHPVLASAVGLDEVVPIDLSLSQSGEQHALIISGPNGGGKSMAMKSFGVVSILSKLGIPIPTLQKSKRPRVDFFDHILVNIGDNQNVLDGESTWTSILNKCAEIIDTIENDQEKSYLILLDEFGSAGTDPEACGAVAQAILEELMRMSCKIVVTTHSPRLKALSIQEPGIGCAAVLLEEESISLYKLPAFKLEYGIIGESYALGAASRTRPSLPISVITRATELMSITDDATNEKSRSQNSYIHALTKSMEEQLDRRKIAAYESEAFLDDMLKCRNAMVALALSYENHLERQLEKLETNFQTLKRDGRNNLELVGNTITELKLLKKKIMDQKDFLAERGLRVLHVGYKLTPGESVVILADGEFQGMTAKVISSVSTKDTPLVQNQVLVRPSTTLHAWDDDMISHLHPMDDRPLIFQRHELAIWDYDGAIDSYKSNSSTSISDSKRKVDSLLAAIQSSSTKGKADTATKGNGFRSSRDRKAASKGKRKRK